MQVWGRIAETRANKIEEFADEYKVSKALVVSALLEVAFNNLDQLDLPVGKSTEQEELPLEQAS